jgi:hypothetical protein
LRCHFQCAGDGGDPHFGSSGAAQHAGALGNRGTRSVDIINQKHFVAVNFLGTPDCKRSTHVFPALMAGQSDLRLGLAFSLESVCAKNHVTQNRATFDRAQLQRCPGDQFRMVEAALPPPGAMQRHWDNHHRSSPEASFAARNRIGQHAPEDGGGRPHAAVLQQVDQFPQPVFVTAVSRRFHKILLNPAAHGTQQLPVRIREKMGRKQTLAADGTQPAFYWEDLV